MKITSQINSETNDGLNVADELAKPSGRNAMDADTTSQRVALSEYGDCDAAEDGHQALGMFEQAHGQSANYDLHYGH